VPPYGIGCPAIFAGQVVRRKTCIRICHSRVLSTIKAARPIRGGLETGKQAGATPRLFPLRGIRRLCCDDPRQGSYRRL
jgi:hypothetical protein